MTKVMDGDSQQGEGVKRSLDILATFLHAYGDEETRERRGKEEQERNMFMTDTKTSAATKASLGKRKIDHACDSLQNPSHHRHDYASSSSSLSSVESKRPRGVSDKPIRAEPIREIKPPKRNRAVRRKGPVRIDPGVTPEWVVDLMRKKNGVDEAQLIIEKEITASDLKRDQGRLLIPFIQMANMKFLNEAELGIMEQYVQKNHKKGVDVILVDSDGTQWELNLRTWGMNTSSNYSLCGGWNNVVLHHELQKRKLKEGQTIRIWSFHSQDGKLYFAFLRLPPAPAPGMAQPQAQPQGQDQAQDQAVALPQAQDPPQAVALPQAHDPDQAMALVLAPAIATSSSSSMAPVVTRDSNEQCEETFRRRFTFPKRRTHLVCVPAPTRDSGDLGRLDLNRPLPQVCMEMAPLEAAQETDRRTSLVSITETTTLDLELRL